MTKKENKKGYIISPIQVGDAGKGQSVQGLADKELERIASIMGAQGVLVLGFKKPIGKDNPNTCQFSLSAMGIEPEFLTGALGYASHMFAKHSNKAKVREVKEGLQAMKEIVEGKHKKKKK